VQEEAKEEGEEEKDEEGAEEEKKKEGGGESGETEPSGSVETPLGAAASGRGVFSTITHAVQNTVSAHTHTHTHTRTHTHTYIHTHSLTPSHIQKLRRRM